MTSGTKTTHNGRLRTRTRHNRVRNTKGSPGTWTAKSGMEAKRQKLAGLPGLSRRALARRLRRGVQALKLSAALEGNEAEATAMRSFAEEVLEAARRLGIKVADASPVKEERDGQ